MASIQRQGDTNSAGGVALDGMPTVKINGRPVVVPGISVSRHPCCGLKGCPPIHCSAVTNKTLQSTVKAGGKPIIVTGDMDTCGHPRTGGSGDVRIG